jgi:hypothetical protein
MPPARGILKIHDQVPHGLGNPGPNRMRNRAQDPDAGPDLRIAAGLTAVRSGALAVGCGGGGVGLLVAVEVRVGAEPFELTACRPIFSDRLGCGIKWDERAVRRFRLAT